MKGMCYVAGFLTAISSFFIFADGACADPGAVLLYESTLEDSEEPFARRIYSYDFAYDSGGQLHVIYSKPVPGEDRCQIIYTYGSVDALNSNKQILSENGTLGSVSTFIRLDSQDVAHVCYIQYPRDPETSLYYQTIDHGVPGSAVKVTAGGWHTRMDLNESNLPVFVRDDVSRLLIFKPGGSPNQWQSSAISLPDENNYRIANFVYDQERSTYHITYGDDYTPRGDGTFYSRYKYASSTDGVVWASSVINPRSTLWELEFWTDLDVNSRGKPSAAMMAINPDNHRNATGLFALQDGSTWRTQRIAGLVCPEGQSAAGMGIGIALDSGDRYFGVWDNSPDTPCNGYDGAHGNIILGYSRDGYSWSDLQQLKPYSAEGMLRAEIHANVLTVMVLGDHTDTHLHVLQYQLNNFTVLSQTLPVTGDFDGDGQAGCGVYYPPTGAWALQQTTDGLREEHFGYEGTLPVAGDFDGDGKTDVGCYYPPNGGWYLSKSADGFLSTHFGYGDTVPVVADFDGDGKDDYGCYYPPNGAWDVVKSREGYWHMNFGYGGTYSVTGDFDGDGKDDYGCYFPPDGSWYVMKSREGFWHTKFGYGGTYPVTADFDGDGKDDFGCYYPPDGSWHVMRSRAGFWHVNFGFEGTLPVTDDFDGDGTDDFGCYHPTSATWYLMASREGFSRTQADLTDVVSREVIKPGTAPVTGDFDGDGKDDFGAYYAPSGSWLVEQSRDGDWERNFGYGDTFALTGDFDGDGRLDYGCYYPPNGSWHVMKSREGYWQMNFGYGGTYPVTADFDGDGKDDYGCYFPPDGSWYVMKSREGFWHVNFGYGGTYPVTADFDGDGKDDFGCYYPPDGSWHVMKSREGYWHVNFGYGGTYPVTGDFDGDGVDDFGCYFPPDGSWYFSRSAAGFLFTKFGHQGTLPAVADFDGDGVDDFGCYDADRGNWYLQTSTDGFRTAQTAIR